MPTTKALQKKLISLLDSCIQDSVHFVGKSTRELTWQGYIYTLLRNALTAENIDELIIITDYKFPIGNNNFLWLKADQYTKVNESHNLETYYNQIWTKGEYVCIDKRSIKTVIPSSVINKVEEQSGRTYKIDFAIVNKIDPRKPLILIELKCKPGLTVKDISNDIVKLEDVYKSVAVDTAECIVLGLSLKKMSLYRKIASNKEIETCQLSVQTHKANLSLSNAIKIKESQIADFIYTQSVSYIDNSLLISFFNEPTWNCYLLYDLIQALPDGYSAEREYPIKLPGCKPRNTIDFALTHGNSIEYFIEIKFHEEHGLPDELMNGFYNDSSQIEDFLEQWSALLKTDNPGNNRSKFPRNTHGKQYLDPHFVDKIIELYYQYHQLRTAVDQKICKRGLLLYYDKDLTKGQLEKFSISVKEFKKVFTFRKELICKLINFDPSKPVEFRYIARYENNGKLFAI